MAGVFDFGTRFGEGYMAGSQLTAQREAKKAQQMNSDRDFALRESQAVIESERANLRDEMARQGLRMQEDSLQYGKQRDIDQRQFQSGEAEKQRTFQGARYDQDAKLRKRKMDLDELQSIREHLKLNPGDKDMENRARMILIKLAQEDGINIPQGGPAQDPPPQAPPPPEAPPPGAMSKFGELAGRGVATALANSPVEPALRGLGSVADMFSPGPPMAQPEPGARQANHPLLPAQSDARALIPRPQQEQAYPPALLPSQSMRARPPALLPEQVPPQPSVFTRAADWLQQAARPAVPQAQQSMPSLAPMGSTGTSSAAMRLPDEGGIAALPDVPGTLGNKPKQFAQNTVRNANDQALLAKAPPEFVAAAQKAEAQTGVPANLLLSLAQTESSWRADPPMHPQATPGKEALGPFQFVRSTGKQYGLNSDADFKNVDLATQAAAQYLKDLSAQFNGDIGLALMAYNQGPEAVRRAMSQQ